MVQRISYREEDDPPQSGEIDLRALGRGLWRRKRWIIGPTVLVALLAFAFVQLSSPYFRSGALILIENRDGAAPRPGGDRDTPLPDEQAVASQVQLIQSRDLVRNVVKALDLGGDPEFSGQKESFVRKMFRMVGLGGAQDDLPYKERVVDKVAENLTVYPVQGSRVVGVEFVAQDADLAARVVNGFIDAYLAIQREAKRESNKQANQYLSDEIANLRGRVGEAEDRVETFRSKAGLLVGTNNTTVAAQQLGDTTIQLSSARTQQAEAQAKADMIRSVMRQGRPAEALDIANSDLVRSLSQQRSQLAAQIASDSRTLLPQHPRMRELQAQLSGLDEQIRSEAEKLARAFENDAKTAGARVAAFSKQLEELKKTASTANGQEVQLRALEREARSQRDLLEQLLTRYRETSARDNPDALLADARVISRGAAATEPYFPKKTPTIALATLGAFVLSLFAAAAAEVFGGQRRPDDTDAAPPPAIGAVPVFGRLQEPMRIQAPTPPGGQPGSASAPDDDPKADGESGSPDGADPAAPLTAAAEAVSSEAPRRNAGRAATIECADATLVAALARQLASMPTGEGALRILTTGAAPDLAVRSVAAELAATISASGRRVVAIDAGGGVPRGGDVPSEPGLSDLLTGAATFAQAIHRDPGSRVHIVPRGSESFDTLDAAAQGRLGVVLEALALTYDFVMLMAPSGPGGADVFAAHCGAAVLVSNAGAADFVTVDAHERLKATGIEDVVVLLVSDGGGAPKDRSLAA
ncbi:MAG TPA: Wzz/FepE/Etk N-terminal domain-containing protein [Hansschlegelia sp.]